MGRPKGSLVDPQTYNTTYRLDDDPGHMSELIAANNELKEEIGVDKRSLLYTERVCSYDDVERDPRSHYVGAVYFRFFKVEPQPSSELKTIVAVPLSQLGSLVQGQPFIMPRADGSYEELPLVLGHDRLLAQVISLPNVQELLQKVMTWPSATSM